MLRALSLFLISLPLPAGKPAADPKRPDLLAAQVKALEEIYQSQKLPSLLLEIAALEERAGACKPALETYQRFFASCESCDILAYAVERFNAVIDRCVDNPEDEIALRNEIAVPKENKPESRTGDASRSELMALLREVKVVDPHRFESLFMTLAESGEKVAPAKLNELRASAYDVLIRGDATVEQVRRILQRLRQVNFEVFQEIGAALDKPETAADTAQLNALRAKALATLESGSTQPGKPRASVAGCHANFEREWGSLTVDTVPWSEVYLNGEKLGSTPLAKAAVLAGCITVRAVDPKSGRQVIKNVTVRPNKNTILQVNIASGVDTISYGFLVR